ncbi:MAG: protein kinase, partial [Planctomycetaceae bacterium]|nr:protein kinase [Planctomycetaceae bacterium]
KVCDAMAYAHHNGVVNRDLKPENIMLGEFGEVLVLDWGLAVPATEEDRQKFTSPAASFGAGTPAYMSPELWSGPPTAIGPWSDIYLLGAMLFEMQTGKPPHQFPEPDSKKGNSGLWMTIDKVVRHNVIRETSVTGELMDIAMKAMAAKPDDRHGSVLELQNDVRQYQKHEESRRLAERARQTLQQNQDSSEPQHSRSYQDFQVAAALFEEAHTTWPGNTAARNGLRTTRFDYAALAYQKGDYDLGLQIASQEQTPEFSELSEQLTTARRRRNRLKSAATMAATAVIVLGIVSSLMYVRIRSLHGDVATLETQKSDLETEKTDLESQKQTLADEVAVATTDREQAERNARMAQEEQKNAEARQREAEAGERLAEAARIAAVEQQNEAVRERTVAQASAAAAMAEAKAADTAKQAAMAEKAAVERDLADLAVRKARAVALQRTSEIASLVRSADYAAARRAAETLLQSLKEDPELMTLPPEERDRRVEELVIQLGKLNRHAELLDSQVRTQLLLPSGRGVVRGDATGRITVAEIRDGDVSTTSQYAAQIGGSVTDLAVSADESVIMAASGTTLHFCDRRTGDQGQFADIHSGDITAVAASADVLLSGDSTGHIQAWNPKTHAPLWSVRTTSGIRDLVVLPDVPVFLYAASRGGESADVLAYRLPATESAEPRPVRLGQLRFPRDRIDPPHRMSVAPDGSVLVLSNSRNGELLVLPRRTDVDVTADADARDRFPFTHPAELQKSADRNWLLTEHQRPVNAIDFSRDGRRLVTGSDDRTVIVWRKTGTTAAAFVPEQTLVGHGARINAVGFLNDSGSIVLSSGADRFCRRWDVSTYEQELEELRRRFHLSDSRLPPTEEPVSRPDVNTSATQSTSDHRHIFTA